MRPASNEASRPRPDGPGARRLYLRKYLRQGRRVASVTPSSRHLANACCQHVDPACAQVIVELGAGTGSITREAAARMHPASRLIAIERDPEFAALASASVPVAEVLTVDAGSVDEVLAERGLGTVDLVLSGLPTPSLPPALREHTLGVLAMAGRPWVSQITVMPWVYQRLYRQLFREVRFQPVWRNLPPGGVYHCRGWRGASR